MTDEVYRIVRKLYMKRGQNKLVFPSPRTGKRHDNIRKQFATALKKAGIEGSVSPYTLRHTFATHLLKQGESQKTVAELLGHSTTRMTERYLHILDKDKETAVKKLDGLFKKKPRLKVIKGKKQ